MVGAVLCWCWVWSATLQCLALRGGKCSTASGSSDGGGIGGNTAAVAAAIVAAVRRQVRSSQVWYVTVRVPVFSNLCAALPFLAHVS